ncbi:hypothetical protein B14911_13917 [Bacillus sp. NRRL B-14911]|nr:hypothetical protein B14911_13917 [Bacillus sp. NRRL B-14911]
MAMIISLNYAIKKGHRNQPKEIE